MNWDASQKNMEIWVEKDNTFYNKLMKSWLEDHDIEMN